MFIYVLEKLGIRIQNFWGIIFFLFFLLFGILMEYYFCEGLLFFSLQELVLNELARDLHFSA